MTIKIHFGEIHPVQETIFFALAGKVFVSLTDMQYKNTPFKIGYTQKWTLMHLDVTDISSARWHAPPAKPPQLSYLDRFLQICRTFPTPTLHSRQEIMIQCSYFPFRCWLSESVTSFVAIWKKVWGWWEPARLGQCTAPGKRGQNWKMPF